MPNVDEKAQMTLANAFWYSDEYIADSKFVTKYSDIFNGEVHSANFKSFEVVSDINQWCKDKTKGKITHIFDFVPENPMVLINSVYYKNQWAAKFDKSLTSNRSFYGPSGETHVATMNRTASMPYYHSEKYEAVRLDMGNSQFAATFVLPTENLSARELIKSMKYADITEADFKETPIDLYLPKCTLSSARASLKKPLKTLGMGSLFVQQDFSMFTESVNMQTDIYQSVSIAFDEDGAEAAAVTWNGTCTANSPEFKEVNFNRSYLFFIYHQPTQTCLMSGYIEEL